MMPPWMKAAIWIGLVCVCLGMVWGIYHMGYVSAENKGNSELSAARAEWAEQQTKSANRITLLEQQSRAAEKAYQLEMNTIADAHREAVKNATDEKETIINDLRSGHIRLRERFKDSCNVPGTSGATGVAPGAGGNNGTSGIKLRTADTEFLLQLAARCDNIAERLKTAQQILISERR